MKLYHRLSRLDNAHGFSVNPLAKRSNDTGGGTSSIVIVGVVIIAVAASILLVGGAYYYIRKRKRNLNDTEEPSRYVTCHDYVPRILTNVPYNDRITQRESDPSNRFQQGESDRLDRSSSGCSCRRA